VAVSFVIDILLLEEQSAVYQRLQKTWP